MDLDHLIGGSSLEGFSPNLVARSDDCGDGFHQFLLTISYQRHRSMSFCVQMFLTLCIGQRRFLIFLLLYYIYFIIISITILILLIVMSSAFASTAAVLLLSSVIGFIVVMVMQKDKHNGSPIGFWCNHSGSTASMLRLRVHGLLHMEVWKIMWCVACDGYY